MDADEIENMKMTMNDIFGGNMMERITFFNPTSTSGPDGYMNYKMSGGDSGGSGGGPGCGIFVWILIILFVLQVIAKM